MKKPNVLPADIYAETPMFAVFLRRKDGSEFIATGRGDGPGLFHNRKAALSLQKELKENNLPGVVRPVSVTVTPVWP